MEINFAIETEKYRSLTYTDQLPYIKENYIDKFLMLDLLQVMIREHPITDLKNYQQFIKNYQQFTYHHDATNNVCRLRISLYPSSDNVEFLNAVERSFQKLIMILTETQTP